MLNVETIFIQPNIDTANDVEQRKYAKWLTL